MLSGGERGASVHAASFIRDRRVVLDSELLNHAPELMRILTHELFHFVWRKLDNPTRRSWHELLLRQLQAPGELGWSAQWRKESLAPQDSADRTRRWREYLCESFCDTAAWYYSGRRRHPEFTLPASLRRARRLWFAQLQSERRLTL